MRAGGCVTRTWARAPTLQTESAIRSLLREAGVPLRGHAAVRRAAGRAAAGSARAGVPGQHRQRGERPGAAAGPHLHRPRRRDRDRRRLPRLDDRHLRRQHLAVRQPGRGARPSAGAAGGAAGEHATAARTGWTIRGPATATPSRVRDAAGGRGRVHLRAGAGQRGRRAGAARLPRARLPARARRRRRLHRRRGAGRLRAAGRVVLGVPAAGRRARHRHHRQGHRQRPSGRRRHHHRPIAAAFHRNAGFFSSVGGSPLSCEIGIAVLDAIRDEGLQENAARGRIAPARPPAGAGRSATR